MCKWVESCDQATPTERQLASKVMTHETMRSLIMWLCSVLGQGDSMEWNGDRDMPNMPGWYPIQLRVGVGTVIEKCYGRLFKHCSLTDEDISLTCHDQETCSNGHTWSE